MANISVRKTEGFGNDFWLFCSDDYWLKSPDEMWLISPDANTDNTFRIILYKALGLLTPDTLKSVILLIPFALLGLFTGIKCCGHMNDKKVHKITTVLLILSGISLVLKNL